VARAGRLVAEGLARAAEAALEEPVRAAGLVLVPGAAQEPAPELGLVQADVDRPRH
jgi:hypothetical protein